jgi:hypothetical protein
MLVNVRSASLEATRTESGADLLRFRIVTQYDEQKIRDAQVAAESQVATYKRRLAETDADLAAAEYSRLAGCLERAERDLAYAWKDQPSGCYFCLEGRQISTAMRMLRGKFKSTQGEVSLKDGYRHISFYVNGIRTFEDGNPGYSIAFPGNLLANAIEAAMRNLGTMRRLNVPHTVNSAECKSFTATVELTRDYCRSIESGFAPWVVWDYAEYESSYLTMRTKIAEDKADARISDRTLQEALAGLECVAGSYSDGKLGDSQPAIIHLSFDSHPRANIPASYYFWIEAGNGRRGMNGGIIAHQAHAKGDDAPLEAWSYSTHT